MGINNGYIISSLHSMGASVIILFSFIHIFKAFYIRCWLSKGFIPVFFSGWFIYILLFILCFTGYLLPWGQMSYWGVKVITNLIDSIPIFGNRIKIIILGDISISEDVTLERFFSLHIFIGSLLPIFIFLHLYFVHGKTSINLPYCTIEECHFISSIYPTFYIKDLFIYLVLSTIFILIYIYIFEFMIPAENNVIVDMSVTPSHIIPEWYFLPFYSCMKYSNSMFFGNLISFILFSSVLLPIFRNFK